MLTLPEIVERPPRPYVAIRREVTIPFDEVAGPCFDELFAWVAAAGIEEAGAVFIRYELVRMPELVVEFGVPLRASAAPGEGMVAGELLGGRYAVLTYWGHHHNLMDVNAVMVGWARQKEIRWDSRQTPEGEVFACRLELYETDPAEEPDPAKWETRLEFKLAD
ncbi:MAG TPA: GyrI-like domain-containing protein [Devosiaceae bacterium]|nr:GyrI-like domain-containing protein [Devosiaceae bacterium]